MARPLSPEKRSALLQAATHAVADQGVMASTSSIARSAGVAEGTLFTYFENKEALFQELYLHLKQSLAEAMMPDYPHAAAYQKRVQHIFQRYVSWGLEQPNKRLTLARLTASGLVRDDTRMQAMEPFLAVSQMVDDAMRDGVLMVAPISFLWSVIEGIANTTIEHVDHHPEEAESHRELGFNIVWKAISK